MNYEKGLVQLQQQIRKWGDEEIVRQTTYLAMQLRSLLKRRKSNTNDPSLSRELEAVVADLNKISYRTIGASFVYLCNRPRENLPDSILPLSLRGVLLLVTIALFVPIVSVVMASTSSSINSQRQIEEIQQEIQLLDERIGFAVTSPFYLNQISPCSDSTFQAVETAADLSSKKYSSTSGCVWEYQDNETKQIIAKDYWQGSLFPALQEREYYRDGKIIARDSFSLQSRDCFKRREYLDEQGQMLIEDCYTEAGAPRDQESADIMLSPIPPMVYWFFYLYR